MIVVVIVMGSAFVVELELFCKIVSIFGVLLGILVGYIVVSVGVFVGVFVAIDGDGAIFKLICVSTSIVCNIS